MRYVTLLAAAASAFVVAGCGDTLSLDPVAKAADASTKQTSEHMDLVATVETQGKSISMTGSGDFQNTPVLGAMSVQIAASGQNVTMREVMQGATIYLSSDLLQNELPSGKSWLSVDLQKAGKTLGVDFGSLQSQSPADAFKQLQASASVKKVGTDTIGGVPTTHYTATLDPAKLAKLSKLGLSVQYQPVDVWIDDQGLVRREHLHDTAAGTTTDMTMNLSNYGETVDVTPPPSSETFDPTTKNGATS